jgi:transglutaminase-like putative cysteine protease
MQIAADLTLPELAELLRQLARHDERLFRADPAMMAELWRGLVSGSIRYTLEQGDEWADAAQVLREGRFDCEDAAAIVAAAAKIWGWPAAVGIGQRPGSRGGHAFARVGAAVVDLCPAAGMGYPPDGEIYRRAVWLEV